MCSPFFQRGGTNLSCSPSSSGAWKGWFLSSARYCPNGFNWHFLDDNEVETLTFIFTSILHLELTFLHSTELEVNIFYQTFTISVQKQTKISFPLYCSVTLPENQFTIYVWVYFWTLCSIGLLVYPWTNFTLSCGNPIVRLEI